MSNINEILAKQIVEKLKMEKLINSNDTQLVSKLANGSMRDSDWKVALEEIINTQKVKKNSKK